MWLAWSICQDGGGRRSDVGHINNGMLEQCWREQEQQLGVGVVIDEPEQSGCNVDRSLIDATITGELVAELVVFKGAGAN